MKAKYRYKKPAKPEDGSLSTWSRTVDITSNEHLPAVLRTKGPPLADIKFNFFSRDIRQQAYRYLDHIDWLVEILEKHSSMTRNEDEQPGCTDPIQKCGCEPEEFLKPYDPYQNPYYGPNFDCKCECHRCFVCECIFFSGKDDTCTCKCHQNLHIYKNHEKPGWQLS